MLSTLGLLGFIQCALAVTAMLLVVDRWHLSHKLLLITIICIGLSFLRGVLMQNGLLRPGSPWVILTMLLSLSIMPILHLFLRSLLHPSFKLKWLNCLHFLPPLLVTLWCLWLRPEIAPNIVPRPREVLMNLSFFELFEVTHGVANVVLVFAAAQLFSYVYLNQVLLKRSQTSAPWYAFVWAKRVHWVNSVVAFVLLMLILAIVLRVDIPLSITVVIGLTSKLLFLLLGFVWALMLLKHTLASKEPVKAEASLKGSIFEAHEDKRDCLLTPKKYLKSGISQTRMEILHERVMKALQQDKLYLDNELTLASLAENISCSAHHLSQVINTLESRSFNEVLNCLRVEEAKEQLVNFPNKTVTDIALDSGFNSKSSFYALFKKATGQTPGAFKKDNDNTEQ